MAHHNEDALAFDQLQQQQQQQQQQQFRLDHMRGILALVVVTILWVLTSNLIQYVEDDESFQKPIFITLTSLVSFSCFGLRAFWDQDFKKQFRSVYHHIFNYAFGFAVCWLGANICFNMALEYTSVASTTAISSSSSVFTLLGAVWLRTEKPTLTKVAAVVISISGVLLITKADSFSSDATGDNMNNSSLLTTYDNGVNDTRAFGDVFALLGAFLYAVYLWLFEVMVGDEYDTEAFLTLVGVTALTLSPVVVHEGFEMPTLLQAIILLVNGVFSTAIGNRLMLYGSLKCGATAATLALAMSIPLSGFVDYVRGKQQYTWTWLIGAGFICSSFIITSLGTTKKG